MGDFFVNLLGYLYDVNQRLTFQKCFHLNYDLYKFLPLVNLENVASIHAGWDLRILWSVVSLFSIFYFRKISTPPHSDFLNKNCLLGLSYGF